MVATMLGEFGAEVIKVEQPGVGDPLRTWGEQKDGVGLFWKSMSRNKQCVTLDLRNADGQELFHRLLDVSDVFVVEQPAERPGQVGARLRVGARGASPGGDAARERVRLGRPEERPARLRHPGRGDERVRPRDRPARRPADPAPVLPGRRGGIAVGDRRRDAGALPPRRARSGRPADRRQPDRTAGPAHRDVDARLQPPGQDPRTRRQPAAGQRAAQRVPDERRQVGGDLERVAEHRPAGVPGHRPPRHGGGPEVRRPGAAPGDGPSRSMPSWPVGSRARTLDEVMDTFERAEVAAAPVYDAQQLLADEHLRARGSFVRGRRPGPRAA